MSHNKNIKPIPSVIGYNSGTFIKVSPKSNNNCDNKTLTSIQEIKQQKQENNFAIPKTPKEHKNIIIPQKNPREIKEFNSMLVCRLCKGYIIEATTINECLHTFCRSCLVKYIDRYKACPKCRSTTGKPITLSNLRPDRALRSLIYKIVPGLYQSECQRLIKFNIGHGGSDCKNQMRGISPIPIHTSFDREIQNHSDEEDYYQEYYSPDELISLSLEYHPESVVGIDETKFVVPPIRYLKCQAACTVAILYRFLASKYAINLSNKSNETLKDYHKIEVIHKGEILPESFTLMDIAYCYNWQRLAPLRLFYRIFSYTIEDSEKEHQKLQPVDTNITNAELQSLTDMTTFHADSSTMVSGDKCIPLNTVIKNNTSNKNNNEYNKKLIENKIKNEKVTEMVSPDKVQSADSSNLNLKNSINDNNGSSSSVNVGLNIKQYNEADDNEKLIEKNNNNKQLRVDNKQIKSEYNVSGVRVSSTNDNEKSINNKHVRINIKREVCDFGTHETYNCETFSTTPINIKTIKDCDTKDFQIKSPKHNTIEHMSPIVMKKQKVITKRSENLCKNVEQSCFQSQKNIKTNNDFKRLRSNDVKYDYVEPEPVVPEAYTSSRQSIKTGNGNKLSRSTSDDFLPKKEIKFDKEPRRSISLIDDTKHKIVVPSVSQIKSENDGSGVKKNSSSTKSQYKDFALTKKIIVPKIEKKLSPDDVPMKFYIKTSPTASEINSSRIDTNSKSADLLSKNRVDFAKNIGLKPNFTVDEQSSSLSSVSTYKTEESIDKSTHRKRKKGKHSKEAGGKRRKLHAEIATQDESLKLKLKITGNKQYSSRHDKKAASTTNCVVQKSDKDEKQIFDKNSKNSKALDTTQTDIKMIKQKPSINIPNLNETLSEESTTISNLIKINEIRGQIESQSHLPNSFKISQTESLSQVRRNSKSSPTASLVNTTKAKQSSPIITAPRQELTERKMEVPPLKLSQFSKQFPTSNANSSASQPMMITSKNSNHSDINKLNILSSTSLASSTSVSSFNQRYLTNCMRYSTAHSLPNSPNLSPISSGLNGNSIVLNVMSPKEMALAMKRSMSLDSESPPKKYPRLDITCDPKRSADGTNGQTKTKIADQKQNASKSLQVVKAPSPPLQGIVKNPSPQLEQLKLVPNNEQINNTAMCTPRVMPTKPLPIILPPASMSVTKMSDLKPNLTVPCEKRPAMEIVRITSASSATTTTTESHAKKSLISSPKPTVPLKSLTIVQQKMLMPKTTRPMPPTIPLIKIKKSATQIGQHGQPQSVRGILTKSHQQQTEHNNKNTILPVPVEKSSLTTGTNKLTLMTSQVQSEQNLNNGDQKQPEKQQQAQHSQKPQQQQNNQPKQAENNNKNAVEKRENDGTDYKPVCDNFGALDLSGKSSRSPSGEKSSPPSSPVSVSPKPALAQRAPGSPNTMTNGGTKHSKENKTTETNNNDKNEKTLNSNLNDQKLQTINKYNNNNVATTTTTTQLTSLQNLKKLSESANVPEKLTTMKQATTFSIATISNTTTSAALPVTSGTLKFSSLTETSSKVTTPPTRQQQIPKLNEISKIRPTIRQQNPSVRNIPNPSALAFRNHNNNLTTNSTIVDSSMSKAKNNEVAIMTPSSTAAATVASTAESINTSTNNSISTTALKIATNSLHISVPSLKNSAVHSATTTTTMQSSNYPFKTTNSPIVSSTVTPTTHDISKMLNNNNDNVKNFNSSNNNNSSFDKKIINCPSTTSNTSADACVTTSTVTLNKKPSPTPSLSIITSSSTVSPSTSESLKTPSKGSTTTAVTTTVNLATATAKTDAQLIAEKKNLHIEQLAANLRAAAANSNEMVSLSTINEKN